MMHGRLGQASDFAVVTLVDIGIGGHSWFSIGVQEWFVFMYHDIV